MQRHSTRAATFNDTGETSSSAVPGGSFMALRLSGMRADRPPTDLFHALFRPYVYRGFTNPAAVVVAKLIELAR